MLNKLRCHTRFQPVRFLDPDFRDKFACLMANSAEPTDLDQHCLQRQGISGFSRTRVKSFPHLAVDQD